MTDRSGGVDAIAAAFRRDHARAVSVLIGVVGDVDLAEEGVADAYAVAIEAWRRDGIPPSPAGWIITTARRPAPSAAHLRAPGAGDVGTRRPHAPSGGRVADAGDRAGVPGVRDDHGAATRPGQGEDSRRADSLPRADLYDEAIVLARMVVDLMPDESEPRGLLSLMLLLDSRRSARTDATGALIPLPQQDRSTRDRARVDAGLAVVRACLDRPRAGGAAPGRFRLQAAIAAVHSDADRAQDTDWHQIVALYDQLAACDPNPIVQLNRAVAVAETDGPTVALGIVEDLPLTHYHLWHVTRAELWRRLGDTSEANASYREALDLAANAVEREFIRSRWTRCGA